MTPENLIRVSAVVIRNTEGHILTVRKRGTSRFMLPGGKPELGETPDETALRECAEELGCTLDPALLSELGVYRAAAANESGFQVEGAVFVYSGMLQVTPTAEIAEIRWLDPSAFPLPNDLAPLLELEVLPLL